MAAMRIATWNVNSLKARLERVEGWLERTAPDVVLVQETKLADKDAPAAAFARLGYELAHHGQGRWNGVAIASKVGIADVQARFGDPPAAADAGDEDPLQEARILAATCGGVRVASVYAPNGRVVGSPFYEAKLGWFARLRRWLEETGTENLIVGGDYNVAPDDRDVWDPAACHGGTHVSPRERAAYAALLETGLVDAYRARHEEGDRYSWWDYRAGDFYRNVGMRIDLFLVGAKVAPRIVDVEIDREGRKGKPTPSDHAPLTLDLDEAGKAYDPGWDGAAERIAARRAKKRV